MEEKRNNRNKEKKFSARGRKLEREHLNKHTNHTYVICAYGESKYLEECILSLKLQSLPSKIIMITSTPNQMIKELAKKYSLPVYINYGEKGITQDWNFALSKVNTKYATLAHQDDIYEPEYTKLVLSKMEQSKNPLIAFTDYFELRNGKKEYDNKMLRMKRTMLFPLRIQYFSSNRFIRRRILSLGDPICCPSVTFCLSNLQQPIFENKFRSCEDWETWEKISKERGEFLYIAHPLMCHRIHIGSTTTAMIKENTRASENYIMYCKFWPKCIAYFINKYYTISEKLNEL